MIKELVGCGFCGYGAGKIIVRDFCGAGDKNGEGECDSQRCLDAILNFEDFFEGDGDSDFGVRFWYGSRRCFRGEGVRLWGRHFFGRREYDFAKVEVAEVGYPRGLLGGI